MSKNEKVHALCRIGLHNWGRWEFLYAENRYEYPGASMPYKTLRWFESRCSGCNKPRTRKVRA